MAPAEQVLAWRHSEAVSDGAPLADAVAEMKRYSRTPIALVGEPAAVECRVSGQFCTGDNLAVARAVAALHGRKVLEKPGRLELEFRHRGRDRRRGTCAGRLPSAVSLFAEKSPHVRVQARPIDAHRRRGRRLVDYLLLPS